LGDTKDYVMKIEDFDGTGPDFRPEVFFTQRLDGWGLLEGPTRTPQKRFTVTARGDTVGDVIRFQETWIFDDGHMDTLNWQIRPWVGELTPAWRIALKARRRGNSPAARSTGPTRATRYSPGASQ
jgi:hypothetical protein